MNIFLSFPSVTSVSCSLGHLLGKGWPLGSLYVMFHCAFVIFQYAVLGQVWYLIASIPGLSFLSKYLTLLEIMTQLTGVGWSASTIHTIICSQRMATAYLTKWTAGLTGELQHISQGDHHPPQKLTMTWPQRGWSQHNLMGILHTVF